MKLREALKLSKDELKSLKKTLLQKAKKSDINAYIGFESVGEARFGKIA